jgi:hypothetical protein
MVLIDAAIIRALLVPSLMALMALLARARSGLALHKPDLPLRID